MFIKTFRLLHSAPVAAVISWSILVCPAAAQEPPRRSVPVMTALQAAEEVRRQTVLRGMTRAVEIFGEDGSPAPRQWTVTGHDPRSPSAMTGFTVRDGVVDELGINREFYPDKVPEGFLELSRVTIDSGDAFKVADREAANARLGFDKLNYRLRTREFSLDPVWTVSLYNAEEEVTGRVEISAVNGRVLRTVWYYRNPETGVMRILDSAWPPLARAAEPPQAPDAPPLVPQEEEPRRLPERSLDPVPPRDREPPPAPLPPSPPGRELSPLPPR